MATNHTEHYQLNLWEPTDKFVREEFNENNQKIDAAIKAVDTKADTKASTAALNTLAQTVAGKGNCRIVTGTYVGSGSYGEDSPTVLDFAATLGKPWIIIIGPKDETYSHTLIRGITLNYYFSGRVDVTWTNTGVKLVCLETAYRQMNDAGRTYQYIAIG